MDAFVGSKRVALVLTFAMFVFPIGVGNAGVAALPQSNNTAAETIDSIVPSIVQETSGVPEDLPTDLREGVSLSVNSPIHLYPGRGVTLDRSGLRSYGYTEMATQTVVQETVTGAHRIMKVLESPRAPTRFTIKVRGPQDVVLVPTDMGMVGVFSSRGEALGLIDAPWAIDAHGTSVPAWYSVSGHDLILHVEHQGAAFPVVADPFVIPAWVMWACGIGFLGGGLAYWVGGGSSLWRFVASGAVGCVFGIIGKKF